MQPSERDVKISPSSAYQGRGQSEAPAKPPIEGVPGGLNTVRKIVVKGVIGDGSSSN